MSEAFKAHLGIGGHDHKGIGEITEVELGGDWEREETIQLFKFPKLAKVLLTLLCYFFFVFKGHWKFHYLWLLSQSRLLKSYITQRVPFRPYTIDNVTVDQQMFACY